MRIGAAETIITPPLGTALAGYFHSRTSTGKISDLKAKALIAGDGPDAIGIVACDLIGVSAEVVSAARKLVQERIGLPGERLMICATHTHTGPETRHSRIVPVNEEWLASLPGKIADAAVAASRVAAHRDRPRGEPGVQPAVPNARRHRAVRSGQ